MRNTGSPQTLLRAITFARDTCAMGSAGTAANELYTRTSVYSEVEPGIIEQRVLKGARQSVNDALDNVAMFKRITQGRKAAILVDLREAGPAEEGVNDVYGHEDLATHTIALALLTESFVSRMVGNMFLAFRTSRMPVKMFSSRELALAWLRAGGK